MDPLGIVPSIAALAAVAVQSSYLAFRIQQKYSSSHRALLKRRYGAVIATCISFVFPDIVRNYVRVERDILHGPDENALAFRHGVTDECNITAVAGAIIAQVAITGISLPNLSSTHWVAHAILLLAVVSGCLAVYYAWVLQRTIGKLYQPSHIRDWLRLGPPSDSKDQDNLRASLAAIFIVSAPSTMVKLSIISFLIGLAIYQGFVWTKDIDTTAAPGDSHDVFITFIVANGPCFLFFFFIFSFKSVEDLLRGARHIDDYTLNMDTTDSRDFDGSLPPSEAMGQRSMLFQAPSKIAALNSASQHTVGDLPAALEKAAQAHVQCAEADRLVAMEYAKLSQTE